MTTKESVYQPLPAHWSDHVRDAYYSVNWPMPNKMDFGILFVIGAVAVATVVLMVA